MRGTVISESTIRTIDPQWTNDNQDYPFVITTSALFPVVLTVSNAPIDGAIKVTNPYVVIKNQENVWAITRLDSTHSAEFDIPANQCPNIYVADNSQFPPIYIFEGTVCATGVSQKTIAYTNTLPFTFYTMKFAATLNGTIDTHAFNVTNSTKPASLYVIIPGQGQIYQAYLGSPLSLATTAAFFHQYLNYQGFDFLSFIPIIFASMFTRNTVGIGSALVVVCIATLSWLSIVVVPDTTIFITTVIAVLGLVGYRGLYG